MEIWKQNKFRLFLSYPQSLREDAQQKVDEFSKYGIHLFVDFLDIPKGSPWRETLKVALQTMDALVGLVSEDFLTSEWCNQEVGFAIAKETPAFPINCGVKSYGFLGDYQEFSQSENWVKGVVKELLKRKDTCSKYLDAFIIQAASAQSYEEGNTLGSLLEYMSSIFVDQARRLYKAYVGNSQLHGAYNFSREEGTYLQNGQSYGLKFHLKRLLSDGDYKEIVK